MPQPRSARAWARLARISTSSRTASIPSDRFIFSKTGSLSSSNRPCQSFILFCHQPRPHHSGQAEVIDKAFGIVVIVASALGRHKILAVETERRVAALHGHRALVESHGDGAGDDFLRLVEESVERFSERGKPLAVVDQLSIGEGEDILLVLRLAIERERFQLPVGRGDERSTGRFIYATRFGTDNPVFDAVDAADSIGTADFIQVFNQLYGADAVAIEADRDALLEVDGDFAFAFGARAWVQRQHVK